MKYRKAAFNKDGNLALFPRRNRWRCLLVSKGTLLIMLWKMSDASQSCAFHVPYQCIQPSSWSINQKTQVEQFTDSSWSERWTAGGRTGLYGLCFWDRLLKSRLWRVKMDFQLVTWWYVSEGVVWEEHGTNKNRGAPSSSKRHQSGSSWSRICLQCAIFWNLFPHLNQLIEMR